MRNALAAVLFAFAPTLALATAPSTAPWTAPRAPWTAPRAPWNGQADVSVNWKGKPTSSSSLPDALGPEARRAVRAWEPFAAEHEYRMELTDDERVLLVTDRRTTKRECELIDNTLAWFDEHLSRPSSRAPVGSAEMRARGESRVTSWGRGIPPLETRTAVILELKNVEHYRAACEHVAKIDELLEKWASDAHSANGFVLDEPLVGAYLLDAPGNEEWDADAELVNRVTQLLLQRRFGRQPNWVVMGVAWNAEMDLRKGIYCFPGRDSFVSIGEHGSWDKALRAEAKAREKQPLDMRDLHALRRGTFESAAAHHAFGALAFLLRHHADAAPDVLESFRTYREEHEVTHSSDGTWELVGGYEIPPDAELGILQQRVAPDVLARMQEFFLNGKRYKAPKAKRQG